jgi:hypothetical protein
VCEKAEKKTLSDCLRLKSVNEFLPQMPVDYFSCGGAWQVLALQKNKLAWPLIASQMAAAKVLQGLGAG